MPNDINKLRRLMRRANYLKKEHPANGNMAFALKSAWWYESFRDAMNNGMARFVYRKADGTTRIALGTRSAALIPVEKQPKGAMSDTENDVKAFPYFDLEKMEWRSFNVLNFESLEQTWTINK